MTSAAGAATDLFMLDYQMRQSEHLNVKNMCVSLAGICVLQRRHHHQCHRIVNRFVSLTRNCQGHGFSRIEKKEQRDRVGCVNDSNIVGSVSHALLRVGNIKYVLRTALLCMCAYTDAIIEKPPSVV